MTRQKPTFIEHFKDITDLRLKRKQLHKLEDVFFIALWATICGYDSWVAVEKFAKMKLD